MGPLPAKPRLPLMSMDHDALAQVFLVVALGGDNGSCRPVDHDVSQHVFQGELPGKAHRKSRLSESYGCQEQRAACPLQGHCIRQCLALTCWEPREGLMTYATQGCGLPQRTVPAFPGSLCCRRAAVFVFSLPMAECSPPFHDIA